MNENTPQHDSRQPASTVIELEEKVMFQQQTLDELNGVVLKQQTELEGIGRELQALRTLVRQLSERIPGDELPPEKPPHY